MQKCSNYCNTKIHSNFRYCRDSCTYIIQEYNSKEIIYYHVTFKVNDKICRLRHNIEEKWIELYYDFNPNIGISARNSTLRIANISLKSVISLNEYINEESLIRLFNQLLKYKSFC